MAIDFTLSDSQQELQKNAKAFAEGVLRPIVGRIDRADDGWESFLAGERPPARGPRRLTKSLIPSIRRAGLSMLDLAIAAEELTGVDVNVPTTLLATGLGLQPVIQFGTPEQKERFLRPFADDPEGDLLASYAFTDVAGGRELRLPGPRRRDADDRPPRRRRVGDHGREALHDQRHRMGPDRLPSCTPWYAAPTRPRAPTTRWP